jgi:hypothetical protein
MWIIRSHADIVVYLDRLGVVSVYGFVMLEPFFNPKTVNASVGESVQFVARFSNIEDSPHGVIANYLPGC